MATYTQLGKRVVATHGFMPKTCRIAHVMADHGLTRRVASNRLDPRKRKHPCPPDKRPAIENALRYFGMI